MDKLTQAAKDYASNVVSKMERGILVAELEYIGVACYDYEPTEDLVESYFDSIEAKDIDFDFSIHLAKHQPHHLYMDWVDIEEFWE